MRSQWMKKILYFYREVYLLFAVDICLYETLVTLRLNESSDQFFIGVFLVATEHNLCRAVDCSPESKLDAEQSFLNLNNHSAAYAF